MKKLLRNKVGGIQQSTGVYILILALVIVGSVAASKAGLFDRFFSATGGTGGTGGSGGTGGTGGTSAFCIQNPTPDLQLVIRDSETATTTYREVTTVLAKNGNVVKSITSGGGDSDGTTTTTFLQCGNEYSLYAQSNESIVGGLLKQVTSADTSSQNPVYVSSEITQHGNMSLRFFDLADNAFLNASTAAHSVLGTDSDYLPLNATGQFWGDNGAADTAIVIGNDGTLDVRWDVKTILADRKYGKDTMVCLDIADDDDASDWDQNSVGLKYNGQSLTEMKATLTPNDVEALSGWEKCYLLGSPIGEISSSGELNLRAGSGQNPDFDPRMRFLASIVYRDDENPNNIIGADRPVFFRTDSTNTEAGVEEAAIASIDIS